MYNDPIYHLEDKRKKLMLLQNDIKEAKINQTLMATMEAITTDDFFIETKKIFKSYPVAAYTKSNSGTHSNIALEASRNAIDEVLFELVKVIATVTLKRFKSLSVTYTKSIVAHVRTIKMSERLKTVEPYLEQIETTLKQYHDNPIAITAQQGNQFDKWDHELSKLASSKYAKLFVDKSYKSQELLLLFYKALLVDYRKFNSLMTQVNKSLKDNRNVEPSLLNLKLVTQQFIINHSELSSALGGLPQSSVEFYPALGNALDKYTKGIKYNPSLEHFVTLYYRNDRVDILSDLLSTYSEIALEASFIPTLFATLTERYPKSISSEERTKYLYDTLQEVRAYLNSLSLGQAIVEELNESLVTMVRCYEHYVKGVAMDYKNAYKSIIRVGDETNALTLKSFSMVYKQLAI